MQSLSVQSSSRMTRMDSYRGLAILLVVFFHSVANLKSATGRASIPILDHVTSFFDPYRMPMLLVLSGLLLQRALAKPMGMHLDGKVRKIL